MKIILFLKEKIPEVFVYNFFQHLLAKYGGRHTVTMLPGDGIGPEMSQHIKEIFEAAQVRKIKIVENFKILNSDSTERVEQDKKNQVPTS